jgi:hypothetical protein
VAYLAWLKKKEETRKKEENARKKKAKKEQEEMAKKNKPKPKTVQAAKTMGSAGEGWLKNKDRGSTKFLSCFYTVVNMF